MPPDLDGLAVDGSSLVGLVVLHQTENRAPNAQLLHIG